MAFFAGEIFYELTWSSTNYIHFLGIPVLFVASCYATYKKILKCSLILAMYIILEASLTVVGMVRIASLMSVVF